MEKKTTFVLRQVGSSNFVKSLPHDFEPENFVAGWEHLSSRALTWKTEGEALAAKQADPDGTALMVEPI